MQSLRACSYCSFVHSASRPHSHGQKNLPDYFAPYLASQIPSWPSRHLFSLSTMAVAAKGVVAGRGPAPIGGWSCSLESP